MRIGCGIRRVVAVNLKTYTQTDHKTTNPKTKHKHGAAHRRYFTNERNAKSNDFRQIKRYVKSRRNLTHLLPCFSDINGKYYTDVLFIGRY